MKMKMLVDAGSGSRSDIRPDIHSMRMIYILKDFLGFNDQIHHFMVSFGIELR